MVFVSNRCKSYTFLLFFLFCSCGILKAQLKVYPPFWWKGMQNDTLSLILKTEKPPKKAPIISGNVAQLIEIKQASNPKYYYLKLLVNPRSSDSILELQFGKNRMDYLIKSRKKRIRRSLDQRDVMYLISPDRFANGNLQNDQPKGMKEKVYSRDSIYGRHGGDIDGILAHLDYIQNLGINSLWICPLLTNDMPEASYHGYAITDNYSIDPRFGDNELYRTLIDNLHQRGMTMVMDMVYNHVGTMHHFFQDLPDSNFFNFHRGYSNGYKQTNYRAATLFDPHASKEDLNKFNDGWFVSSMPDINQNFPPMAEFLIQNSIWWIEEFGVDAFRVDTYTYPDQKFMGELAGRIKMEYPEFFIFGETWVHGPEIQSYFVEGNPFNKVNSNLDAVTDFQLAFAIQEALVKEQGWTEGITKVYYRLAADYLYQNPENHVTFLDNHDLARIFGHVNGDIQKLKIALGMLFTIRGIPCLYYGTEVLMRGVENHGLIREDFSGGWPGDKSNKFLENGRSAKENLIHNYISELLKWRAGSLAMTKGEMKHFVPENRIYVYFRYFEEEVIMVVVNSSEKEETKSLELDRFNEIWPRGAKGENVMTKEVIESSTLDVQPLSISIFKLVK